MAAGAPDAGFYLQDCEARKEHPEQTREREHKRWTGSPERRWGTTWGQTEATAEAPGESWIVFRRTQG